MAQLAHVMAQQCKHSFFALLSPSASSGSATVTSCSGSLSSGNVQCIWPLGMQGGKTFPPDFGPPNTRIHATFTYFTR
eukprot:1139405-Pelagomonas_calceolata.AAC.4